MEIINSKYNVVQFQTLNEVFENLPEDSFIITDSNVYHYYQEHIAKFKHYVFTFGEEHKTLETVELIYEYLINNGCNRKSTIIGIGGGITTDIAGYVASTFMRGTKFGVVPTTLLAMVDAAIGGKNGVNFCGYKNMIGSFRQPNFIYICDEFLNTLLGRDIRCGWGEVLKYGIGLNDEICWLSIKYVSDPGSVMLGDIINKCVNTKLDIVDKDQFESGDRKLLNLGHTIAHAIEKYFHDNVDKYGEDACLHGEAVAKGLFLMTKYAANLGYIGFNTQEIFINTLKSFFGEDIYNIPDINEWKQYISCDKKSEGSDDIWIVIPTGIGKCKLQKEKKETFIENLCSIS